MTTSPRPKLHLVFAADCAACKAMEPVLNKWQVGRGFDPPILRSIRDVTSGGGEVFSPKMTPGLAVELDGKFVATHEGAMTAQQLERWYSTAVGK